VGKMKEKIKLPLKLQVFFASNRFGRAFLHIICFINTGKAKRCWEGIKRDLFT